MAAPLYLFDDARARAWEPFSLTRPIGELLLGCLKLRERAERVLHTRALGHLSGDPLLGFEEPGAPPVVAPAQIDTVAPRVLLSSRAVLAWNTTLDLSGPATLTVGGQVVGWVLAAGEATPGEEALLAPEAAGSRGPGVELRGRVFGWPWELVAANGEQIQLDVATLHKVSSLFGLTDVHILGDHHLSLAHGAHIEPGVVMDTREGSVRLESGAYVQAPARLTGPLFVGQDTVVFGGSVAHSSIGPVCKVRGEIDTSVVLGYCNKAHDGYLGHALLGRWVNLGAFTTNSDLKNNYSPVRVTLGRQEVDTGLLKVGCFLGDHVKTGIGTLLNTGTVVGAGSNLFGGGMPPKYVPPFSWGSGDELTEFRLEKFFEVAEAAMSRRGVELSPGMRILLERAFERTRAERS
jgi:UDP-N-acetylglucosamine diphosphorylase/glucosamine-1-phosphate N-acetyltransferase